jgi:broad specificity phosphatase PhoE
MVGSDPPLSQAGTRRAQALAHALASAGVKAIYVTHFQRTRLTAVPLAALTGDSIQVFAQDDASKLADEVWARHRGEAVLIVGHGDTVPAILRAVSGRSTLDIPAVDYDALYVVTRVGNGPSAVLRLKYGETQ